VSVCFVTIPMPRNDSSNVCVSGASEVECGIKERTTFCDYFYIQNRNDDIDIGQERLSRCQSDSQRPRIYPHDEPNTFPQTQLQMGIER